MDVFETQADLREPVQHHGLWQQRALPLLQRAAQVTCTWQLAWSTHLQAALPPCCIHIEHVAMVYPLQSWQLVAEFVSCFSVQ